MLNWSFVCALQRKTGKGTFCMWFRLTDFIVFALVYCQECYHV